MPRQTLYTERHGGRSLRNANRAFGGSPQSVIACLAISLLASPAFALDVPAARQGTDATFSANLALLATKCEERGLQEQAEVTRKWIIPRDPRRQTLFLPADRDPTEPKKDASDLIKKWHEKFREHRNAQAAELFTLATKAADEKDVTAAVQLLNEVLRENPDHELARKVLGYPKKDPQGNWPRAGAMLKERSSAAPIPLLSGKKWVVETGHFNIATNAGPVPGKEVGVELEKLHDVWQQLFARHWLTAEDLKTRLAAGKLPLLAKSKRQVKLFKNRQDYLESLIEIQPNIELSKGIYSNDKQTAFLYAGDDIRATWYHEATHQLFNELGGVAPNAGVKQNAWILEGIATYMESLAFHDGYCTLGGFDAERLQDARFRLLMEGWHVPLENLVQLNRDDIPKDKEVRKLYTESAGLTHFLMDHQRGKYRAALGDYLVAVYQGRDATGTLAALTGVPYAQLDAEYRASLAVTDDDLAALKPSPHVPGLRLARTSITDKGLAHLTGHPELEWVDLAHTKATDEGLAFLKDSPKLRQLMLDGTGVTDASLPAIGKLRDLEELDLASLPITDDGLAHLSGLKKLKVLYLANTKITTAGLAKHLAGMKFEILDVEGTEVDPAVAKKFVKP